MEKYHRGSLRLQGYNYASVGSYFITVCTQDRKCLFGEITEDLMRMNRFGKIVNKEWLKTSAIRSNIELDEFVIMPNHFHGIIRINDNRRRGTARSPLRSLSSIDFATAKQGRARTSECFGKPVPRSIPTIIRSFKSAVTNQINKISKNRISIWQRGYYDHIIRDDIDLNRIREYVQNNPLTWERDENNLGRGDPAPTDN